MSLPALPFRTRASALDTLTFRSLKAIVVPSDCDACIESSPEVPLIVTMSDPLVLPSSKLTFCTFEKATVVALSKSVIDESVMLTESPRFGLPMMSSVALLPPSTVTGREKLPSISIVPPAASIVSDVMALRLMSLPICRGAVENLDLRGLQPIKCEEVLVESVHITVVVGIARRSRRQPVVRQNIVIVSVDDAVKIDVADARHNDPHVVGAIGAGDRVRAAGVRVTNGEQAAVFQRFEIQPAAFADRCRATPAQSETRTSGVPPGT